jgi:hypothetical protein
VLEQGPGEVAHIGVRGIHVALAGQSGPAN